MIDIIAKGGVLMYPIVGLSVLSFAIFLERMYTLRISRHVSSDFIVKLKECISEKNHSAAEVLCSSNNSAFSNIAFDLIKNRNLTWQQLSAIAEDAGKREVDKLTRFQDTMGTIVALAPLLGLLGTIFGMIKIFNVLSIESIANAQALSGGIAEALLTTAAGLSVAIPAQIFLHIIRYRADSIIKELEEHTIRILTMISGGADEL